MNRLLSPVVAALLALLLLADSAPAAGGNPSSPHKALKDPAPAVRLLAALALAKENDAESIPVLIDLLAELPRERRRVVEEFLRQLAGEWAPLDGSIGEDEIGRRIRRDAWAAWWRAVEGEALLAGLRKHTPPAGAAGKVGGLIAQLDDEKYAAREAAFQELLALGRIALPRLQEAAKGGERRAARQAKILIERIEGDPAQRLPLAVLRLLAVRKPPAAAESVLAYLPASEDDSHSTEARQCLAALALREGKLEPALLRALADARPETRALAAEALVQGGGAAGRDAVRERLRADAPVIRLRIALALARAGSREGVATLIDLLAVLPDDEAGLAEEALCQLAGDTAPDLMPGTEKTARNKYRAAWAAWWKVNADRVDLARLSTPLSLGYTLICDTGNNRVYEIDRHGKERWAIENVQYPFDACMLPGNRVLIAEYRGGRVTERDLKGNIVWENQGGGRPVSVQRLRNGNTLIGTLNGGVHEVDRAGKEVATFNDVPGDVTAAYRTRKGVTVCLSRLGQCVLFDAAGKQIKNFSVEAGKGGNLGGLDVRPDGHLFIVQGRRGGKVTEYDGEGKKLREFDAPNATTATALTNGHILVASQGGQRVYELNRAGKIVWEYKGGSPYRARRR